MLIDPGDPKNKEPEDRLDPVVDALIDRNCAEDGKAAVAAYVRQQLEGQFWPIGLCVAWIVSSDSSAAADLYVRHRLGMELRPVEGWPEAQTKLVRALASGHLEAWGIRAQDGERVSIARHEWIDLRIVQRGPYDEVRQPDGSLAYREARIEAEIVRKEWPAETPALKTIRAKLASEKACLEALIALMKQTPNDPVPKRELEPQFPRVSSRTFKRLYSEAARDSECAAWSKGGRRRRQPS